MDPLKPFSTLVHSLRRARAADRHAETSASRKEASAPVSTAPAVKERLRARVRGLDPWNPARARTLFVECVLQAQFGEALALDPTFSELIAEVERGIAEHPSTAARLDQVLRTLARSDST